MNSPTSSRTACLHLEILLRTHKIITTSRSKSGPYKSHHHQKPTHSNRYHNMIPQTPVHNSFKTTPLAPTEPSTSTRQPIYQFQTRTPKSSNSLCIPQCIPAYRKYNQPQNGLGGPHPFVEIRRSPIIFALEQVSSSLP